jgi:NAD(P)-dependent dehydrogenase (short-subunit alcohol dehydrogenase family)
VRQRSHRALSTAKNLLQNRIILVTGASDGIGREAALTYAEYGASVILIGRNEEKLRGVAQEIEAQAASGPWYTLDLLTCTPAVCQELPSASAPTIHVSTACCTTPVVRRSSPDG